MKKNHCISIIIYIFAAYKQQKTGKKAHKTM